MNLPIFYINLDRDIQRRALLEAQLERLSLTGTRLPAVWWSDLDESKQSELYSAELNQKQYYTPLVNGEKGCYASHIAAWRQLLDSTAPAMVVLEDDVQVLKNFETALQAIAELEHPWDMIKLMGRSGREKIYSRTHLIAGHDLIQYTRVPSFTAAYVISRTGAQKMLQSRIPFGRPIDIDLRFWWENNMQIRGVYPPVVELAEISQATSIGGRQKKASLHKSWRKLWMKAQLLFGNLRHH